MTHQAGSNDFDVAKKVSDELKVIPKDRQARVLRWVAETLGIESVAPTAPDTPGSPPDSNRVVTDATRSHQQGPGTSKDIRAFTVEKAPQSDNQFAAVVAYYYRFEAPVSQRKTAIGGAELQEAARLAGRRRLSNPRQTLKNAKNMGYLDNIDRGQFAINTVGENLVAMTLPGGGSESQSTTHPRNSSRSRRRRRN